MKQIKKYFLIGMEMVSSPEDSLNGKYIELKSVHD